MVERKALPPLLRGMDAGHPRRIEKVEVRNMREKNFLKELLQRIACPRQKVRSDTPPHRWTAPAHLLPHPIECKPVEAATCTLPLSPKQRKQG